MCSGYGGLELGVKAVVPTLRTVAYVEIEAFACANLVAKMEEGLMDPAPVFTDIKCFPAAWFSGKVHGLLAGYPCQPVSIAGKRVGLADPRYLWPDIRNAISIIRPEWCFFENVSGHVTLGLREVLLDLEELGYRVENDRGEATWGLFTASEVGAPHKRERVFILAVSERDGQCGILRETGHGQNRAQQRTDADRQGVGDGGKRAPRELANAIGRREGDACLRNRVYREKVQSQELNDRDTIRSDITGSSKLGDSQSQRCGETGTDCGRSEERVAGTDKLADTENIGVQRNRAKGQQVADTSVGEEVSGCDCRGTRWPARPGQEQYDWEEPRTVKSGMGRTVDGFKSRVDELRLLGNGVVPQTAELAFRTLMSLFTGERK